jgi:hypothetical protein
LFRFALSPAQLFWQIILNKPEIVHLNTSMEPKIYWRDFAYLIVAQIAQKKIIYQVHGGALPQPFFK